MRPVELAVAEDTGMPCVSVSHDLIWSLVEFLAFRRVQADFSYRDDIFLAIFPHLSVPAAQQLLDDWTRYDLESPGPPPHSTAFSSALAALPA